MSLDATYKQIGVTFTEFWLGSLRRLRGVSAKVEAGTFDADELAKLVGGWWGNAADLAFSFYPASNSPPVVSITGALKGGAVDAKGSAFIDDPSLIRAQSALTSSDLVWLGDSRSVAAAAVVTIPAANVVVAFEATTLGKFSADVKYNNANLVAGTYQGVIYSGTTVAGLIVLNLS